MGKKLYIGNLPFAATDQVLLDTFAQCGKVESVKIITDRETGRSKGFAFVEMSSDEEAAQAISKFNGADYDGRSLTVSEARPMVPRERRPGFGPSGGSSQNRSGGRGGFGGGNRRGANRF